MSQEHLTPPPSTPDEPQTDSGIALNKTGSPETPPSPQTPAPSTAQNGRIRSTPTIDVRWHKQFVALCEEVGITPEDLLGYYRATLQWSRADVQPEELSAFVTDAGTQSGQAAQAVDAERLLNTLKVVAHAKAFPPLVNHPSEQLEDLFDRVIRKGRPNGIQALADLYWTDVADVSAMLREYYPHLVFQELEDPQDLLDEIKFFIEKVEDGAQKAQPFHEQALAAVEECWEHLEASQWQAKLDKLGRQCGFDSMADFKAWAEEHVPPVSDWLGRLKKPTQPGIPHFGLQQHQESEDF